MIRNWFLLMGRSMLVAFSLGAALASAQEFPQKSVRIVVPFPPGGVVDLLARGLADQLTQSWGQPVVVENKPGANTMLAGDAVAHSPPDGYTLLMGTDATVSMSQYLYKKVPYDPVKDFVPVAGIAKTVAFLVASNGVQAKDAAELVKLAKTKPGELNYASFGPGSTSHLDAETFSRLYGLKLVHVPYKGIADIMTSLVTDQVQLVFSSIATPMPYVKAGRMKALAVDSPKRLAIMPDVPTFAELGLKEFESRGWFGLLAPAGTPPAVVEKIANSVSRIVKTPAFEKAQLRDKGLEPQFLQPLEFSDFLRLDREYYGRTLGPMGIKLD